MPVEHASPEDAGNVEEERLDSQNERHPLVVADLAVLAMIDLARDLVAHGQPVGVLHPAVVLRVLLHGVRERRRHPALDREADVLLGRNQQRKESD